MLDGRLLKAEAEDDEGFSFNTKVTLYIPATIHREKVSNRKQVTEAERLLSKCFGGCTTLKATGSYVSFENQNLIEENTTLVYSNTSCQSFDKHNSEIVDFMLKIKKSMKQECVCMDVLSPTGKNHTYFL